MHATVLVVDFSVPGMPNIAPETYPCAEMDPTLLAPPLGLVF